MLYAAARHNLSPRGDGNNYIHQKRYELLQDTTYPREGTETLYIARMSSISSDTTYPREGTETEDHDAVLHLQYGHNLSPRGDGNMQNGGANRSDY